MSTFTDFYLRGGTDYKGRTLSDIILLTDEELEKSHDVIQWMFPLNEPSRFHLDAPVLTAEDINELRDTTQNGWVVYKTALSRFMSFLGMEKFESRYVPGPDFEEKSKNWLHPHNHNMKRITRVIRCAIIMGRDDFARILCNSFSELTKHPFGKYNIEIETLKYWQDAVDFPLDAELNVLTNRVQRL